MKARQENGAIKRYVNVPKSFGNVMGGFNNLSSSELQTYGFYDLVTPSYNSAIQELGDIEWDADSSTFTYPVINKTWTETVSELKAQKILELKDAYNRKLVQTDWYIIRAQEGIAAPQSILDDRAALRTECATKEGEINALTTKASIVSYSLPNLG